MAAIGTDGTVYLGGFDGAVYALNASNGTLKWTFSTTPTGNILSSPAIDADGILYIGSNNGRLYAINTSDGTQRWVFNAGGAIVSSPSIGNDGTIYFGTVGRKIYALNGGKALAASAWPKFRKGLTNQGR